MDVHTIHTCEVLLFMSLNVYEFVFIQIHTHFIAEPDIIMQLHKYNENGVLSVY